MCDKQSQENQSQEHKTTSKDILDMIEERLRDSMEVRETKALDGFSDLLSSNCPCPVKVLRVEAFDGSSFNVIVQERPSWMSGN